MWGPAGQVRDDSFARVNRGVFGTKLELSGMLVLGKRTEGFYDLGLG